MVNLILGGFIVRTNIVDVVQDFMLAGDMSTDTFNPRQTALYIGLQLEEMAEKLEAILCDDHIVNYLNDTSNSFKNGEYDDLISETSKLQRQEMLDADVDLVWVTIGAAFSAGSKVHDAVQEVARSNMAKIFPDGTMHKNEYGKIIKPPGWTPPDLSKFVCQETG